jgi:argininosuccinate synthase
MRIVLAYSGSVEGSAAIQWLRNRHSAEVVAVTLDLGQGRELEAIRDRALALGAQRAHVLDTRDEFAEQYVVPALRADALHDGHVPMALALSRPLIARKIVEIAGIERADAVAHTGHATDGASQLDRLLAELAPAIEVLTPARGWTVGSAELLAFARANGIGTAMDASGLVESNFWGRSLRQSSADVVPAWFLGKAPDLCLSEPAFVDIAFVRGVPTALNGVVLPLNELVASLSMLAAAHGVGHMRNARLLCEAPAAVLLHTAHAELTRVATPPEVLQFSAAARLAYVDLVEKASWFSPLREGLDAYFSAVQTRVNGHVRLRLFKGEYATMSAERIQAASDTSAALRLVPLSVQH